MKRVLVFLPAALLACGPSTPGGGSSESGGLSPDAGTPGRDAGNAFDAGAGLDAGTPLDAGNSIDAGPELDAGPEFDAGAIDAGNLIDAGNPLDAGNLVDAGNPLDAGGPLDAGSSVDAGSTTDAGTFTLADVYGIPWDADGLNNDQIGYVATRRVAIRFRSQGGTFNTAKVFFIFANYVQRTYCDQPPFDAGNPNNCYGAGTGGIIRVDLVDDDGSSNHWPSANVLASTTITDPMNSSPGSPIYGTSETNFRVLSGFSHSPNLVAGRLYHLVFTNIDPDPHDNYISIDCLRHTAGVSHRQPVASDIDFTTLYCDNGTQWIVRAETPVFEILYAGGGVDGQGYMGTRVTAPEPIADRARARESFVPTSDETVTSVSLRLLTSGSPSPLTLRLETSNGTLIEQGTLPASAFSTTLASWATYTFASPHLLSAGQGYDLLLTASSPGEYVIFPLEKGSEYAFDPRLIFGDGHADYDDGDAGFVADFVPWGDVNHFDYQLYFTTR